MVNTKPEFSPKDAETVLRSKEARQLLSILKKESSDGLSQAAEAAKNGDYTKAVSLLKPLIEAPDSKILLQELNQKLGRN